MHAARKTMRADGPSSMPPLQASYVGCSGWRYWKWRGLFYPVNLPEGKWFDRYAKRFDTVELNASFYSWPTVENVKLWRRQPGKRQFIYTIKVCELITRVKRFKGTKTLIRDFGLIADILGERMGCFLFQIPPSYRYTKARLNVIVTSSTPRAATSSNFGALAGGTKMFTAPSVRQA
jgi:uncharacterized protein YecE (DUF72 family)